MCWPGKVTLQQLLSAQGGNDLGRIRSEELFRSYKEALGRVRDLEGSPVLCGILPCGL